MKPVLQLKQGEVVLGVLELSDIDFPWACYSFQPAEEFQAVKPLFDRELEHADAAEWEQFEEAYRQIEKLGLRLVDPSSGEEITDFLLHLHQDDTAWLRY